MSDDESNTPEAASAPPAADGKNANRKRRMSKRERKNLKKKKLGNSDASSTTAATSTSESAAKAKEDQPTVTTPTTDAATTTTLEKQAKEPTLEEYMENYTPAPSAKVQKEKETTAGDSQSLGKWFPKASVIKSNVSYTNDVLAKLAKEKKKLLQKTHNDDPSGTGTAAATKLIEPKASLVLFYQYVSPTWSQAKVSSFLAYLTVIAKNHRTNIGGRIRVSPEGINATVSAANTTTTTTTEGSKNLDPAFEAAQTLRHFCEDLRQFDSVAFANTDFKYIDGLSADRHFKETKLLPVKELVFYGIRDNDCAMDSSKVNQGGYDAMGVTQSGKEIKGGVHLDAKDYHEMLKRNDAVVIDVRNHYEAAIGRFDGQMKGDDTVNSKEKEPEGKEGTDVKKVDGHNDGQAASEEASGAEYIDPKMRKSTDFTSWLAAPETKQKLEGKTVMMFCTGGIRCERASAYLNSQMGSEVKGVYQLQGGIERYLQAFPEGGFYRGKNFVFDKREAIGAGNVNGDGGVIRSENNKHSKEGEKVVDPVLPWGTQCAKCNKQWDRYIGKRKCYTCGVPVLVCDACCSGASSLNSKKKKKKKKANKEDKPDAKKDDATDTSKPAEGNSNIRCPLCVEEGITVPAEDVEFTDNGVRNKLNPGPTEGNDEKKESNNKAAKSVLKWGGGHATKRKEKRKWSKRLCQFGSECVRKDCFFYHPEREGKGQKVPGKCRPVG